MKLRCFNYKSLLQHIDLYKSIQLALVLVECRQASMRAMLCSRNIHGTVKYFYTGFSARNKRVH